MKIWFISDTHCQHSRLTIPEADIVIHCGDESTARNPVFNAKEAEDFFEWFRALPVPTKIFVPGNHSTAFERGLTSANYYKTGGRNQSDHVVVLQDTGYWCDTTAVYGSPWTPAWGDSWAYMRKRHKMYDVWQSLPTYVDILVTHGPPKGILDLTHDHDTGSLIQVGCNALRKAVDRIKPKIHAFGHIHDEEGVSNFGMYDNGVTKFINCSVCDRRGKFKNNGVLLEC